MDVGWTKLAVFSESMTVTDSVRTAFSDRLTSAPAEIGLLVHEGATRGSVRSFHRVVESGGPVLCRTHDVAEAAAVANLHVRQATAVGLGGTWLRLRALVRADEAILVSPGLVAELAVWERRLAAKGWTLSASTLTEVHPVDGTIDVPLISGVRRARLVRVVGAEAVDPPSACLALRVLVDAALIPASLDAVPILEGLVGLARSREIVLVHPMSTASLLESVLQLT